MAKPGGDVAKPGGDVAKHGGDVAKPGGDVAKPGGNMAKPEKVGPNSRPLAIMIAKGEITEKPSSVTIAYALRHTIKH